MDALTVLDDIRIATPCQASWDEMPGDDRVRSCPACSRAVYNIAAMTSDEVAALITSREGRLCGRLFRRADGTVITADCPGVAVEAPPTARPKSSYRRTHALVIILIALLLAWTGNNTGESPPLGSGVTWDDWVHWAAVSLGPAPDAGIYSHADHGQRRLLIGKKKRGQSIPSALPSSEPLKIAGDQADRF
jgi:hypothetical protein